MIGCLWTRVHKQPIIALYFESENELMFYNLEARSKSKKYLLLIGGIEEDKGPRQPKFSCVVCFKSCESKCIGCDHCAHRMHKSYICGPTAELSPLYKRDESWSWANCVKPNASSIVYSVSIADTDQTQWLKQNHFMNS